MTPEEMKFWLDVLASPAVVTFAGGLLGACVTLGATWFKNRHDASESDKAWQRQEERRREERAFEKKTVAYENFFNCFEYVQTGDFANFRRYFIPLSMHLMTYGPLEVKIHTREAAKNLIKVIELASKFDDYSHNFQLLQYHCDEIHTAIMKDMDMD